MTALSGKLTAPQVDTACVEQGKMLKLADGGGLFLQVERREGKPDAKAWRFRYKRAGKDALMSLGVYPEVTLHEARIKAQEARAMLGRGADPQAARQRERDQRWIESEKTFGVAAAEYNAKQAHLSPKTVERCARMLKHSAKLHNRPFSEITRPMLLDVCRVFEHSGKHETAHRLGIYFSQVFRYARDEGYFNGVDPTAGGFGKSLKPVRETHQAALTDPKDVGGLMRNVDSWEWLDTGRGPVGAIVGRALQLLARTAVRPGELRQAEWPEFDLTGERHDGKPTWRIPVHRMKMRGGGRTDHIVPLSRQAAAILEAQRELTGDGKYVFPNARTGARPMTDAALSVAMVALGYRGQHVPHGFRAMFKSLAQDVLKADSELVERQLAHKVGNDVAAAYDRSQRLEERRALMQSYSDLLERLRDG